MKYDLNAAAQETEQATKSLQSLLLQIASKSGIITNVDFTAAGTFMGSAKDLCKNTEASWLSWMLLVTFILVKRSTTERQ